MKFNVLNNRGPRAQTQLLSEDRSSATHEESSPSAAANIDPGMFGIAMYTELVKLALHLLHLDSENLACNR